MTEGQKKQIDGMTRMELCRRWRFGPVGDALTQGDTGQYFKRVLFEEKGGFTPEISKALGWSGGQDVEAA